MSRTCTRCGKTYPATTEHFRRQKTTKLGLTAECKACLCERMKEWQRKNPDKLRSYKRKAATIAPEKKAQYGRTYRERKRARLEQLLAEKDARIFALETELAGYRSVAKLLMGDNPGAKP